MTITLAVSVTFNIADVKTPINVEHLHIYGLQGQLMCNREHLTSEIIGWRTENAEPDTE